MPDIEKLSGVSMSSIEKIDGIAKTNIEKIDGLTVPSSSSVGFLGTYQGAVAAYSLSRLDTGVLHAIRVINDSSSQADIGFTLSGDLDTTTLLQHCGNGDGRIVTWYDQSGNSNHMTQSTQADMPYIVDSGSVIVTSTHSSPTIDFYFGSNGKHLSDTFSSNNGDHFILSYVGEFRSVTAGQYIISQWSTSTSTQTFQTTIMGGSQKLRLAARYSTSSNHLGRADTTATVGIDKEYVVVGFMSASPYTGDIDTNGDTATTLTGFPTTGSLRTTSRELKIGQRNNGNNQYQGYLSEVIIWSDTTLPNRDNIMTDTKSYYGIT
jgi:hypothetical protein